MNVIDDRLVDVPANQIHRRQRGHRASGLRTDEIIHVCDAVLGGELRNFVQHLEADAISDERGTIFGDDNLASEPLGQHRDDGLEHRGVGVNAGNHFGADDHVRRIE